MTSVHYKLSAAMAAVAVMASTTLAGPLEVNRLPADTAWVIHVDLEQVRGSAIGQYLLSEDIGLEIDDMREDMQEEIGFDLFAEGMDLTLQGPKDDDKNAVIVVVASPVVDNVIKWIEDNEPSYQTMDVDGYHLHTWVESEDDEQIYLQIKTIAGDRRQVVLSPSMSRLLLTLKTMESKAPNVSTVENSGLTLSPAIGSLVYFQAAKITNVPDVEIDKRVADAAGRVTFNISEHSDVSRVELACTAEGEDQAKTLSEIVQGAVALGKLITSCDEETAELHYVLSQTQSKAVGNEITLRFEMPSEELRKLTQDD